ncbi:MAG TPA: dTMP kinase [Acidimicrobiia bacterium]|nr:dTMP kinase [Acidimicrobiia bacterium]
MNGFYLALEGGEGAGKTSVATRLAEILRGEGETVVVVREPGGTPLGEEIRRLLLHSSALSPWSEALLFAAQRAQLVTEIIRPALEKGSVVISDRSLYSSLAYQGGARGLGVEEVREVNLRAVENLLPHLVLVLDVEAEVGLARQRDPDRIGGEGADFQERVMKTFAQLAAAEPQRVMLVRATGDVDETVNRVLKMVNEHRGH